MTSCSACEVGFATDDYLGKEEKPVVIRREEAAALLDGQAPIHFVFHSAFCASTMLVRAIDLPGSAMGISEPVILNDMAGWRRRGADVRRHATVMNDVLGQLSRPWGQGEAVVVKPSNVFNGLAMGALALRPEARALIFTPRSANFFCRSPGRECGAGFGRANCWKACSWRAWSTWDSSRETIFGRPTFRRPRSAGWPSTCSSIGSPGRSARPHRDARQRNANRDPAASIAKVAARFGLRDHDAGTYAAHPAIARNSKSGAAFERGERQMDQARARETFGDEIEKVAEWIRVVGERQGISLELPFAL